MHTPRSDSDALAEQLVSVARSALGDGRGVLVTTDTLSPDDFDEFAVATKRVLADAPK